MSDLPNQADPANTGQPDKEFWALADTFIHLSNTHSEKVQTAKVSNAMLFATSRFNAFVVAANSKSKEQLAANKEEAVAYFLKQYEDMLRENLQDHIDRFDQYKTQ